MTCAACGTYASDLARFCSGCGTELAKTCPRCGFPNPLSARFCSDCAAPLGAAGASPPTEAERRQLTVLFCDLVGSTELSERLDPEDLREVMQGYHAAASQVIRELDGYVAQYLGDGILAYFGYPIAHEDDARRAILAGLEIIKTVSGLGLRRPGMCAVRLQVRIGIHTGPVVLGSLGGQQRQERLALGEVPHLAARIQSLAEPGAVVISDATHRLTKGLFESQRLGPQTIKGISQPTVIHRVIGPSLVSSRVELGALDGLTPLVGRAEELALLEGHWGTARNGGSPVVLVTGEPGIGKSRLLLALKDRLAGEVHEVVECRCSAHHQGRSLHPIIKFFERRLGLVDARSPDESFERLRIELAHGRHAADVLSLLAALLSIPAEGRYTLPNLSPQKLRRATFEAIRSWLRDRVEERPTMFVIEDVHWADPSTLEFLDRLIGGEPIPRLFVHLTARPEFSASWSRPKGVVGLVLERLSQEEAAALLGEILVSRALAPNVLHHVLEKADGIPLFVEEITQAVLESGFGRVDEDRLAAGGAPPPDPVPATLHDSLMARLDHLGPGRVVAKLAATLGREFTYEMLAATALIEEGELLRGLERLERAQLIYRKGQPPDASYTFKHALIQDAAYQSLLRSTRQQYHRRIVETLSMHFLSMAEAQPELMAQHCASGGLVERAVTEWERAGQRAAARSAFAEAIGHFSQALEQLASLPHTLERDHTEIRLCTGLGIALISTRGYGAVETEQMFTRAAEICERLGDVPYSVLNGIFVVSLLRGEREKTERNAAILLRGGETAVNDLESQVLLHTDLAAFAFWRGDYVAAERHAGLVRRAAEGRDVVQALLTLQGSAGVAVLHGHCYEVWCNLRMGLLTQARVLFGPVLTFAERTQHPYVIAWAQVYVAAFACETADVAEVRLIGERAIATAADNGFVEIQAIALCYYGWALASLGEPKTGIAHMRQGLALLERTGAMLLYPSQMTHLAEVYLCAGDVAAGMVSVHEAFACTETNFACNHLPALYRIQGKCFLLQGDEAAAEQAFRESLRGASSWLAHYDALRTATPLARLLASRGYKDEARAFLAECLGKITGDQEISPVVEAKKLLAELL